MGAGYSIYRNISRVEPLSQAMVESHSQTCLPDAVGEITDQISFWSLVDAVPVPMVRVFEVAPTLVVLGGQHHIYVEAKYVNQSYLKTIS